MIKEMPMQERPRERLIKYGVDCLSNEELLSIVLRTGTKNKSVRDLSLEILGSIESIGSVKDLTVNKLVAIKGVGRVKAIELIAVIEIGRRIFTKNEFVIKPKMTSSVAIYDYCKEWFLYKKQEYFYALYFDNKQGLIDSKLLFIGTLNKSIVHPREIFKYAYLLSASSIVCVHNHPSGDVNPSKEDEVVTKSLVEIGCVQKIPIIDHVIIGENKYYSFSDNEKIINM